MKFIAFIFSKSFQKYIFIALLVAGIFLRFILLDAIPKGLNQDEASIGYESYSLLKTGKDRWGYKYPVYFIAWESGQNALYAYLTIPFIKALGLSDFSIRLPNAILGLLTVLLVYLLIKRIFKDKLLAAFTALLFLFEPWHFMQSRWALENNSIPFFVMLSLFFFVRGLQYSSLQEESSKKNWAIILTFIPFSLLFYCGSITLFIVPFFLVIAIIFYRKELLENALKFVISWLLFGLFSTPFFLFILKNNILKHPLPFEKYLPFSLPKMLANRESLPHNFTEIIYQFKDNLRFIFSGFDDKTAYNTLPNLGYSHLLVFLAPVGLYFIFKNKNKYAKIFLLWTAACTIIFGFFYVNLNRSSAIQTIVPIFVAFGAFSLIKLIPTSRQYLGIFLLIALLGYSSLRFYKSYFKAFPTYSHEYYNEGFEESLKEAIKQKQPNEKIGISNRLTFNYVYTAFYAKFDPATFQKSNWVHSETAHVYSFGDFVMLGRYYFLKSYDYPATINYLQNQKTFLAVLRKDEPLFTRKSQIIYSNPYWKVVRYL